ncbi:MAG: hypothetical protein IPM77_11660 [Crocinitomicaceae bacterium]|nr:hypothetical protein [Crocinitomicaceae bacterium]
MRKDKHPKQCRPFMSSSFHKLKKATVNSNCLFLLKRQSMQAIRSLSIIHLALIAGQIIFIAVVLVLNGNYEIILQPNDDLFFLLYLDLQ